MSGNVETAARPLSSVNANLVESWHPRFQASFHAPEIPNKSAKPTGADAAVLTAINALAGQLLAEHAWTQDLKRAQGASEAWSARLCLRTWDHAICATRFKALFQQHQADFVALHK